MIYYVDGYVGHGWIVYKIVFGCVVLEEFKLMAIKKTNGGP